MYNNVLLIGRTVDDMKITTLESGLKVGNVTLALRRPFKNQETGDYEVDFIPISLWQGVAEAAAINCKKGSLIIVKGRLAMRVEVVNGINIHKIQVIGERVTFLDLRTGNEDQEEE